MTHDDGEEEGEISDNYKEGDDLDHNDLYEVQKIVIKRGKIESWIDEPYLRKTLKNAYVRIRPHQKYYMARINDVTFDEHNRYEIGNGIKCSLYLDLTLTYQKGNPLNRKYKITYVSNSLV